MTNPCEVRGVSIVVGAPLNAGFLAGRDRYDYRGLMPDGFIAKRDRIRALAARYGTDLRTAALQFCNAAPADSIDLGALFETSSTRSAFAPGASSTHE